VLNAASTLCTHPLMAMIGIATDLVPMKHHGALNPKPFIVGNILMTRCQDGAGMLWHTTVVEDDHGTAVGRHA
jgi:hypothetical protein